MSLWILGIVFTRCWEIIPKYSNLNRLVFRASNGLPSWPQIGVSQVIGRACVRWSPLLIRSTMRMLTLIMTAWIRRRVRVCWPRRKKNWCARKRKKIKNRKEQISSWIWRTTLWTCQMKSKKIMSRPSQRKDKLCLPIKTLGAYRWKAAKNLNW